MAALLTMVLGAALAALITPVVVLRALMDPVIMRLHI